jgi:hypothetical protein
MGHPAGQSEALRRQGWHHRPMGRAQGAISGAARFSEVLGSRRGRPRGLPDDAEVGQPRPAAPFSRRQDVLVRRLRLMRWWLNESPRRGGVSVAMAAGDLLSAYGGDYRELGRGQGSGPRRLAAQRAILHADLGALVEQGVCSVEPRPSLPSRYAPIPIQDWPQAHRDAYERACS